MLLVVGSIVPAVVPYSGLRTKARRWYLFSLAQQRSDGMSSSCLLCKIGYRCFQLPVPAIERLLVSS
jgi:hypothetical protein